MLVAASLFWQSFIDVDTAYSTLAAAFVADGRRHRPRHVADEHRGDERGAGQQGRRRLRRALDVPDGRRHVRRRRDRRADQRRSARRSSGSRCPAPPPSRSTALTDNIAGGGIGLPADQAIAVQNAFIDAIDISAQDLGVRRADRRGRVVVADRRSRRAPGACAGPSRRGRRARRARAVGSDERRRARARSGLSARGRAGGPRRTRRVVCAPSAVHLPRIRTESHGRRPFADHHRHDRARRAAQDDDRLGHPPGARGRADRRVPARGDRDARARRVRGRRPRHGGRRQLQQRLGGARQAGLGLRLRRPPGVRPPHRRLGRLGHRLEGRRGRHALEGRRRGRRPLQPGLLRGSRGPRPRSDGRAVAEDLGLRDDLGLVRPVHEGPGAAAAAQAEGAGLGGVLLVRPDLLHGLPDADEPRPAPGRPPRPHLGRRRRPRRLRGAALQGGGRGVRRRRLHLPRRASWSSSSAPSTTSTATSSPA